MSKGRVDDDDDVPAALFLTNPLLLNIVKAPTEGVLDSKFLLNASEIGTQMARNLKIETGFEIDDYLSRVANLLGGNVRAAGRHFMTQDEEEEDELEDRDSIENWDWQGLGRRAAKRTKRAPTLDFL